MKIDNTIRDLILEYTGRYFRYENDFYRQPSIKFTDANWQKFKNGETAIEKMGAARIGAMLDELFDPYELALITQAQSNYYFGNEYKFNMTFPAYYDMFKKQVLMKWLDENPHDIIGGAGRMYTSNGDMIANAYLEIALQSSQVGDDIYLLQMRFKNYSPDPRPVPSGRGNRLKWIKENLEHIR